MFTIDTNMVTNDTNAVTINTNRQYEVHIFISKSRVASVINFFFPCTIGFCSSCKRYHNHLYIFMTQSCASDFTLIFQIWYFALVVNIDICDNIGRWGHTYEQSNQTLMNTLKIGNIPDIKTIQSERTNKNFISRRTE